MVSETPWTETLLDRDTPGKRPLPLERTTTHDQKRQPSLDRDPPTPPWQRPPSCLTSTATGGTHPTGMHSGLFLVFFSQTGLYQIPEQSGGNYTFQIECDVESRHNEHRIYVVRRGVARRQVCPGSGSTSMYTQDSTFHICNVTDVPLNASTGLLILIFHFVITWSVLSASDFFRNLPGSQKIWILLYATILKRHNDTKLPGMLDIPNLRNLKQQKKVSPSRTQCYIRGFCKYRSGTVNSKSFVGKVLLRIKWKFELNYTL